MTVQAPDGAQQDPVGGVHGFGTQERPEVQVPVQLTCVVTVQVSGVAQHAPVVVGGHGFEVQTPPWAQPPAQFASVVTVQVPSTQQEPVGGVAVGLSSPPQPTETIVTSTARITSLLIHSPSHADSFTRAKGGSTAGTSQALPFGRFDARHFSHPRLCYPPTGWNRPEQCQQENAKRPSRIPAKCCPGMPREAP